MLCPFMDFSTSPRRTLLKACLRSTKHGNSGLLNSIALSCFINCSKIYMTIYDKIYIRVDRLCRKPCCSSCTLNAFIIFPTRIFVNIFKIELSYVIPLNCLVLFYPFLNIGSVINVSYSCDIISAFIIFPKRIAISFWMFGLSCFNISFDAIQANCFSVL